MTDKALADILARTYTHCVTAFRPLAEGEERLCEAAPCALSRSEHTYRVTVSAASDRERDGNTALLSSLTPVLLRGVPMGERTLHPLELKTEGETLTFTVELCVPLAQPEKPAMEPPGRMATLNLDI